MIFERHVKAICIIINYIVIIHYNFKFWFGLNQLS